MFDSDGNGTLTVEELKSILGTENGNDDVWKQIITEVDKNKDG